jgi:hypothetical protein
LHSLFMSLRLQVISVSFVVYSIIAWSPIQLEGPSCSHTTTYIPAIATVTVLAFIARSYWIPANLLH